VAIQIQFTTIGFVTMGFGDAVPSLCSQAFGAGNAKLCHVWLAVRRYRQQR
jgi:Na+-driven multidrug efflux pump